MIPGASREPGSGYTGLFFRLSSPAGRFVCLRGLCGIGVRNGYRESAPRIDPVLVRLQRRLDRWELPHLRQHAAELAQRLEEAEKRADDLAQQLSYADDCAEHWREQSLHLDDPDSPRLALTQSGNLYRVVEPAAPSYSSDGFIRPEWGGADLPGG